MPNWFRPFILDLWATFLMFTDKGWFNTFFLYILLYCLFFFNMIIYMNKRRQLIWKIENARHEDH